MKTNQNDLNFYIDPLLYYQVDPEFDEFEEDLIEKEYKQLYLQEIDNVPF